MSGKKQHIIPQFLQRNFSDTNKIYRYSLQKEKAFGISIGDNYAQNYVYSHTNNMTLDTKITEEEGIIFNTLNSLLKEDVHQEKKVTSDINRFILHFFLRNKYIYNGIYESLDDQLKCIKKISRDDIVNMANNTYSKNRSFFTSRKITNIDFQNLTVDSIGDIFKIFNESLLDFKESKVMYEFGSDNKTTILLEDFKYRIEERTDLFCTDVTFCAYDEENKTYNPYIDKNTSHILFPLSKNKLLVLYKEFVELNKDDIEKSLISCCYDSFSIDKNNVHFLEMKKYIKTSNFYNYFKDNEKIIQSDREFKNKVNNLMFGIVKDLKTKTNYKEKNTKKKKKKK